MTAPTWLAALAAASLATVALAAPPMPAEVHPTSAGFADAAGKALYVWDIDTMVGMSHCEADCAAMWPPLKAPPGAQAIGDWSPIGREDGSLQWTYKTKPLYTYSADKPGAPPTGEKVSGLWHLAH